MPGNFTLPSTLALSQIATPGVTSPRMPTLIGFSPATLTVLKKTSLVFGSVPAMKRSSVRFGQASPASAPVSAQMVATLMPGGHPMTSRVAVASLGEGRVPLLFVSALAAHTPQMRADPRCSLLVGDMGKGDPLTNPRLMLTCRAHELAWTEALRETWLAAHPKGRVYVDLADFVFVELRVEAVSFVGGFGRAYAISGAVWMAE